MDKIKIVSLNVRGLQDNMKRKKVFQYLKKFSPDICMLQETHCKKEIEMIWHSEWGNRIEFSNGTSAARGVATLFSKKLAKSVVEINRDMEGRMLHCKVKIDDQIYGITNIYAPNTDVP